MHIQELNKNVKVGSWVVIGKLPAEVWKKSFLAADDLFSHNLRVGKLVALVEAPLCSVEGSIMTPLIQVLGEWYSLLCSLFLFQLAVVEQWDTKANQQHRKWQLTVLEKKGITYVRVWVLYSVQNNCSHLLRLSLYSSKCTW